MNLSEAIGLYCSGKCEEYVLFDILLEHGERMQDVEMLKDVLRNRKVYLTSAVGDHDNIYGGIYNNDNIYGRPIYSSKEEAEQATNKVIGVDITEYVLDSESYKQYWSVRVDLDNNEINEITEDIGSRFRIIPNDLEYFSMGDIFKMSEDEIKEYSFGRTTVISFVSMDHARHIGKLMAERWQSVRKGEDV